MIQWLFKGSSVPRKSFTEIKSMMRVIRRINELEPWARSLDKNDFPKQTAALSELYQKQKNLDALIPKAFALVREAGRRTLGERLFNAQLLGGIVLHQGRIAEMKTGEGKTLTSTTAAYLNSLTGEAVHIVTVNDYLAQRDANWMRPVFEYLGKTAGYIISSQENAVRRDMYSRDIVYATNNELGFDYLRDNLRIQAEKTCAREYNYCIIDEIDSVLIDEARTPLIISGPSIDDTAQYVQANSIVSFLTECEKNPATGDYPEEALIKGDYKLNGKNKSASFTSEGIQKIESILQQRGIIRGDINSIHNFEFVHYVTQCLRAHKLFFKDVDYIVSDEGKVEIVDEFTGRVLHGRRYSDGLHQAIEAKEGIRIERQNRVLASITFQNFFKMYKKLSGMTGTAATEEKEFVKIYGLDVVELPTNRPVIRDDKNDLIFITEDAKNNAIAAEILRVHEKGQPILIGTASIENSEKLARLLKKHGIPCNVLNAKNHEREAYIIGEAGVRGAVTIATNMAGRGTDIKLGGHLDMRIQKRLEAAKAQLQENAQELHKELPRELPEAQRLAIEEEERAAWLTDYNAVKALGGLYILGTERHESRRIDNQLRGRSGRQGDPGESLFFLSLDDQLMRLFGQGIQRLRSFMAKSMDENEPLYHPLITRSMERAQRNVEERNFEIRKHLLDFDSVLSQQRMIVYKEREDILHSDSLIDRLCKNVEELVHQHVKNSESAGASQETVAFARERLLYTDPLPAGITDQEFIQLMQEDIRHKASLAGEAMFNELIRMEYLQLIDARWQDHIEDMETLRQAVYLRSYAQKNPLLEYSLEGFSLFDAMLENIAVGVLRIMIGLKARNIRAEDAQAPRALSDASLKRQHTEVSLFSASADAPSAVSVAPVSRPSAQQNSRSTGVGSASIPQKSVVVRTNAKVGRNDPCPCGSGKKYKFCCGKAEQ